MAKANPIIGMDARASLFINASLILQTRTSEMLAYERYIAEPDRVYELHQMRIAAKRLRYTLEIFQGAFEQFTTLGKPYGVVIEEIKGLQEHLGDLHDADVLLPQLTEHLGALVASGYRKDKSGDPVVGVHHVDFDACQGMITVCQEIRFARDRTYQKLLRNWARLQEKGFINNLHTLLQEAIRQTMPEAENETSEQVGSPMALATDGKKNAQFDEGAHGNEVQHEPVTKNGAAPRPSIRRTRSKRAPGNN